MEGASERFPNLGLDRGRGGVELREGSPAGQGLKSEHGPVLVSDHRRGGGTGGVKRGPIVVDVVSRAAAPGTAAGQGSHSAAACFHTLAPLASFSRQPPRLSSGADMLIAAWMGTSDACL